jgi:crotonobetainyl-CoA:carnitine CoA-transferase CaiB-like acyl-CoA transferase
VLDLTTARAELCGRLLADLGAEVIKIEPPGGAESRKMPPWADGDDGSVVSLYWAAVGLGKQSLVLDLGNDTGRDEFRRLVCTADVLVESYEPGVLSGLGLGAAALLVLNPALIYVSVTPYGQDGPLAHAPASALTIEAAGGLLSLQGDRDRPPLPVGYPQAWFHAGAQAAADTIIALNERRRSGRGQHLDVSAQACMVWTLMQATGFPPNEGTNPPGTCEDRQVAAGMVPGLDPTSSIARCADGAVFMTVSPAPGPGGRTLTAALSWAASAGDIPPNLLAEDWASWTRPGMLDGTHDLELFTEARRHILAFLQTRNKGEVFEWALEHDALIAPVNTVADVSADPQLGSRDYWREIGGRRYPGAFARFSRTPIALHTLAPALGSATVDTERRPSAPGPTPAKREQAFTGLKTTSAGSASARLSRKRWQTTARRWSAWSQRRAWTPSAPHHHSKTAYRGWTVRSSWQISTRLSLGSP